MYLKSTTDSGISRYEPDSSAIAEPNVTRSGKRSEENMCVRLMRHLVDDETALAATMWVVSR
jgi:hypothetical protein